MHAGHWVTSGHRRRTAFAEIRDVVTSSSTFKRFRQKNDVRLASFSWIEPAFWYNFQRFKDCDMIDDPSSTVSDDTEGIYPPILEE